MASTMTRTSKDGDVPMIVISMILVLVGAVTLVIGFFNAQQPGFIYVTIAASLLAGVLLLVGLLRQRSARSPVLASGSDAQPPRSWGAGWGSEGAIATLDRDDAAFGGVEDSYDDPLVTSFGQELDTLDSLEEPEARGSVVGHLPDEEVDWWVSTPAGTEEPLLDTTQLPKLETDWEEDNSAQDDDHVVDWDAEEPATPEREAEPHLAPASSPNDGEVERFFAALNPVRGIGPSKQAELLAHFKTLRRLRNASVERIAEVPGISTTLAQRVYNQLHR